MKKKTAKPFACTARAAVSATFKKGSRKPFQFIGTATTKDGTEYELAIHRREHFPVLLHVESDVLIELTWDFLVTVANDSRLHALASSS